MPANQIEQVAKETGALPLDAPDKIYFIESGKVTGQLEFPNLPPVRLETMKSGRVIGELGFYLGQKRTAAVVADEPSIVYLLSTRSLAKMDKKSPELASKFHQLIIQLMAARTMHLIRTLTALAAFDVTTQL